MKKRVKNIPRRKGRAKKARPPTPKKRPPKRLVVTKKPKSLASRPPRTRTPAPRSRFKLKRLTPIKIQSGPKEKTRFVRHLTTIKTTRGKRPKLSPQGISKIKRALKKMRAQKTKGKRYNEQISVKIRYKGANGEIKTRWENLTSTHPDDLTDFLDSLDAGITYTQYFPGEIDSNGEERSKIHHFDGRGSIQQVTYEKITQLPNR